VNETRRSPSVYLLVVLLFAESALLIAAAVYLVVQVITDGSGSVVSAIALTVLTAVGAAALFAVARGVLAGRAWTRSAALVWQIIQGAVGIFALQGEGSRPDVGWGLLIPAIVVVILLFTKSVIATISRRE
jgi:hypothetical protein